MDLVVRTPDELIAAVPHVLGFKPEESIVVLPVSRGLPVVRVDLPRSTEDRDEVLRALREPLARNASPGARIAVVCVSDDRQAAELASRHLAAGLEAAGIGTELRLWATNQHWVELDTGATGDLTRQAADRVATITVLAGAPQPAASRASLAASLVGNREPIAEALPAARQAAMASRPVVEHEWALERLQRFDADCNRLSDADGARMLVALETIGTRDALWADMTRENVATHVALWSDLTRRAPDEVRAAPAALLGFASWLSGDGARAWCALDQVPADGSYPLAELVASALQHGLNPREWERMNAQLRELEGDIDESYVPAPRRGGHRPADEIPRPGDDPNRAAPGR